MLCQLLSPDGSSKTDERPMPQWQTEVVQGQTTHTIMVILLMCYGAVAYVESLLQKVTLSCFPFGIRPNLN